MSNAFPSTKTIQQGPFEASLEIYQDRVMVILTEIGRISSLVQVDIQDKEDVTDLIDGIYYEPSVHSNLLNLLGQFTNQEQLLSNAIATLLLKGSKSSSPLPFSTCVVGLGLSNKDEISRAKWFLKPQRRDMSTRRRPFTARSSSSLNSNIPRSIRSSSHDGGDLPEDVYENDSYMDDDDDDESSDADVFAFGPPSTADGNRGELPPSESSSINQPPLSNFDEKYLNPHDDILRPPSADPVFPAQRVKRWSNIDSDDLYQASTSTHQFPPTQSLDKLELEYEEDSPYPEVRASVSNTDDPDIPTLTLRVWVVGGFFSALAAAVNTVFNFRLPAPTITPIVLQLITYPAGKFLAYILPMDLYTLPAWLGGKTFTLNPGPFNIKEHTLITIMANVSVSPAYAMNVTVVTEMFYGYKLGTGFDILLFISSQCIGFGLAGFCRRFVVWPAYLLWPQCLVVCTLLNTLHAEDDENDGSMSRFKFFIIVGVSSVIWYFVPGFLFKALSWFSWICWIWPRSPTVNQLFGVFTGLGMGGMTFDWSQITYIGSPLVMPWWAECNVAIGFFALYWLVVPILYYTNAKFFNYLPISDSSPYDKYGNSYNISRILSENSEFNQTAYEAYSPLYISATYSMVYLLGYAVATAVLVHTILYHGKAIWYGMRNFKFEEDDIHAKLMRRYPDVPHWWYLSYMVVFLALSIAAVTGFDAQIPVWGVFVALLVPLVYILPASYIFAMTGQEIPINLISEVIPGYLFPGKPIANMIFKCYSIQTMSEGLSFIQDAKLGHYIKVPPRATFAVQVTATIISALIQIGIRDWMFSSVNDMCSVRQSANFTCPQNRVYYTSSVIWGIVGPDRFFGHGRIYHYQVYALIVGAVLPIPVYFYVKHKPRSWLRNLNWPVMLTGPTYIPPATGINYSSWIGIGFIFQYLVRRTHFAWWSKYNFILSAALDAGTTLGIILVFLLLQLPKNGSISVDWWGNSVYMRTADYFGMPYRTPPANGFGEAVTPQ
ncbi:hypothetical protein E3P92_03017 [Wallemia ichthyophaga]|uniref:Glutathione transporter 1 n=1 Tax=Wallemia ichthyophaga TaxID=245174 RepID=A0A4T0JFE6_WALIC|nr:hypothetical protein E3P98_02971 [Wallemia ichthyophaga]TIA93974.1 hypothetical protein E3P97_00558 [Wallemia ichthyophaga]TIA97275.1 hypothetical protein E3P95_02923 [Wallemia ichthyophaga]TIA98455.1 hypothetical protein E3P94_02924 [Wallemia ichthyophaga]TIB09898.1 hypothetical protein E3P93_03038 [Wallemia ichthyophaga]